MNSNVPPAIRHGSNHHPPWGRNLTLPSAVLLIPLRYLLRKLGPLAYQVGYTDGWHDAIAQPRRKARR